MRAHVNEKDYHGRTVLMCCAADKNALDIVRVLVDAGANLDATDENGKTALVYAVRNNAVDVAALLRAAGARQ